jgi:hypothetical protein
MEWDLAAHQAVDGGVALTVDFDPASLQLAYAPTGVVGADSTTGTGTWSKFPAQQTGQSTTLSLSLTFDTSTSTTGESVQARTDQLVLLTRPDPNQASGPARRVVRFNWGSFLFYGAVQSLQQTIDFFSDNGIPLRSTVALALSEVQAPDPGTARPPAAPAVAFAAGVGIPNGPSATESVPVGSAPLTLSQAGDSVQAIVARSGVDVSWKAVAAANGIDNPRLLPPGTVLDLSARLG